MPEYYSKERRVSSEIYELRRQGKIDEARQIAEKYLQNNSTDENVLKAYAWTLIDVCKREKQEGNVEESYKVFEELSKINFYNPDEEFTKTILRNIQQLKLSLNPFYQQIQEANELVKNGNNNRAYEILSEIFSHNEIPSEFHVNYGWTIYRYLRDHISVLNSVEVRTILRNYLNLKNERPSNLHSQILNIALKYSKEDTNFKFVTFFTLWGSDNLNSNDFVDSQDNNGNTIPSLMVRIAKSVVNYPINEIIEFINLLGDNKNKFLEIFKEQFYWKIYNTKDNISDSTWTLFNLYLSIFKDCAASPYHSKVLALAERTMIENNTWRFYDFFKQWNPKKLEFADWLEETSKNGENYKPLAIKAIQKAKKAIENLTGEQIGDISWLIDLYDKAIQKFPDDDWNIRSKALILLRIGQQIEAQSIYKKLCLKMGEKYYIWSEFADCWNDTNIKISLLCKALSLEKNEDFIGKIRLALARLLIKSKKYDNAIVELEQYKSHYTKKDWHINSEVYTLINQCSSATPAKDKNTSFYAENIQLAENHAYSDIPFTEMILVEKYKNKDDKERFLFINGNGLEFSINKNRFPLLRNTYVGQVWNFKLYNEVTTNITPGRSKHEFFKIETTVVKSIPLMVAPSEAADWANLPIKYGYIQHVNTKNKVYHIYSTESNLFYEHYNKQTLNKGDFVTYREYRKKVKEEEKVFITNIERCEESKGLQYFKCGIAVVDDINEERQLFHFVLDSQLPSGILQYEQTELRPTIGSFIKIHYFQRTIPTNGKKVIEVIKAEPTNKVNNDLIRNIQGNLVLKYHGEYNYLEPGFAFIKTSNEDYYVHKTILKKYLIRDDCNVKAKAIYTIEKGWKVFEIEPIRFLSDY